VASQTGTGSTFVMNTSPTLVTPNIGVASATSLNLAAGTSSLPSLFFNSDTNTGIYLHGTDSIGLSVAGTSMLNVTTSSSNFINAVNGKDGSASNPAFTFVGMTDGGLFRESTSDYIGMSTNGNLSQVWDAQGDVGIGGTPNANAVLDVQSTTKAFMPPRMTTTQKNAIASPTAGMVVYDSTLTALSTYNGSSWVTTIGASILGAAVVPGIASGNVDTFSVSFGTTNGGTACTASPCSYLDQIGTAVSSITRSGSGAYSLNTARTYTKLKCQGTGVGSELSYMLINGAGSNAFSFASWNSTGGQIDSYMTIDCTGTY